MYDLPLEAFTVWVRATLAADAQIRAAVKVHVTLPG